MFLLFLTISEIIDKLLENCEKKDILYLQALEDTIKKANDYERKRKFNRYNFASDLLRENILKIENMAYFGEIIKGNINIKNPKEISINGEFLENEFSSAIYRLLNNALKHKYKEDVYFEFYYENYDIYFIIKNKVRNCDSIKFNIESSLKKDSSQLFKTRDILQKYRFKLQFECKNNELSIKGIFNE